MNGEEGKGQNIIINEGGSGKVENPQVAPREFNDDEIKSNFEISISSIQDYKTLNEVAIITENHEKLTPDHKNALGLLITAKLKQFYPSFNWFGANMGSEGVVNAVNSMLGQEYPGILKILKKQYEAREEARLKIDNAVKEAKQTARNANEQARVESQAALAPAPEVTTSPPTPETPKAESVEDKVDPAIVEANKAALRYSVGPKIFNDLPLEEQDRLASMEIKDAISLLRAEQTSVYVETYIATTFGTEVWNQLPPEKQKELIDKYKDGGESAVFIDLQPIAAEILAPDITKLRKDFQQAQAKTQEENDRINTAADEKLKKTREREDAKLTERQAVLAEKLIELNNKLEELKAIGEKEIKESEAALLKINGEQNTAREARLAEQNTRMQALNAKTAIILEDYKKQITALDAQWAELHKDEDKEDNPTP